LPPTAEAVGRLGALAVSLRDACVAALAVIDEHPDAYLYPGLPPIEVGEPPCDGMLAVYVPNISRLPINLGTGALASQGQQFVARVPSIRMTVVYAMCVNVWGDEDGDAPSSDDLTEQSIAHMQRGWILMNGIHNAVRDGTLFDHCRNYSLGDLTPLSVQGNSAGWSFDVVVQTDGFDPFDAEVSPHTFHADVAEQGTVAH
jgi:hypothetical protein